jgi:hypothetical protein
MRSGQLRRRVHRSTSTTYRRAGTALAAAALAVTTMVAPMVLTPAVASASDAVVAPSTVTTVKGTNGGEPIANFAAVDGAVVTYGAAVYVADHFFTLPAGVMPQSVWGLTLRVSLRGPKRATQRYTWKAYDVTTKKWVLLGDNVSVTDPTASRDLVFYLGGALARFVDPATNRVRVRLQTAKAKVAGTSGAIDAETLLVESGALPEHPGWHPAVGTRWQYQLQGDVDPSVCATPWTGGPCVRPEAFDIDLYDNDGTALNAAAVDAIHAMGAHAICYVSGGSIENWRPDASLFPKAVIGRSNGWPGEKWLDIRRLDVLLPIMRARAQRCADAGFDAIEWDNVDGSSNHTGFPVTASDQVTYNRALAAIAHDVGLSVGLKNDVDQLTQLLPWFDFAVNEQCAQYHECDGYDAWVAAGKAVVQVEYSAALNGFCPDAIASGRSAIKKALALDALPYQPCA